VRIVAGRCTYSQLFSLIIGVRTPRAESCLWLTSCRGGSPRFLPPGIRSLPIYRPPPGNPNKIRVDFPKIFFGTKAVRKRAKELDCEISSLLAASPGEQAASGSLAGRQVERGFQQPILRADKGSAVVFVGITS
jgi:hypothetical protein